MNYKFLLRVEKNCIFSLFTFSDSLTIVFDGGHWRWEAGTAKAHTSAAEIEIPTGRQRRRVTAEDETTHFFQTLSLPLSVRLALRFACQWLTLQSWAASTSEQAKCSPQLYYSKDNLSDIVHRAATLLELGSSSSNANSNVQLWVFCCVPFLFTVISSVAMLFIRFASQCHRHPPHYHHHHYHHHHHHHLRHCHRHSRVIQSAAVAAVFTVFWFLFFFSTFAFDFGTNSATTAATITHAKKCSSVKVIVYSKTKIAS